MAGAAANLKQRDRRQRLQVCYLSPSTTCRPQSWRVNKKTGMCSEQASGEVELQSGRRVDCIVAGLEKESLRVRPH